MNSEARKLAEQNYGLAVHLATKYARRYPRVNLDDLTQVACVALLRAAELHDPSLGIPFAPYAMKGILWAIWDFVNRNGAPKEVSLETPIGANEDGELTLADEVDADLADDEIASEPAEENEGRVYCLLADLIQTSPELSARERKILRLSYLEGLPIEEVRRRVGPPSHIGTESAIAIRKLRAIMLRRGFRALPVEAPVMHASGGRPPRL